MVISPSRQLPAQRVMPPVAGIRTGDGARYNRRGSPLGHSVPQMVYYYNYKIFFLLLIINIK